VKRTLAGLITLLVLGAVLWQGRGRPPAPLPLEKAADTPEACVERMFAAAQRGDVPAYLDCFTGSERDRLERALAGQRPEAFAQSLRDAVATLKGRAVFRNGPPGDAASAASIASYTIDRVYETRTERQLYRLTCAAGVWRIETVATASPFQPDKAYGSPVYEDGEPNGGQAASPAEGSKT